MRSHPEVWVFPEFVPGGARRTLKGWFVCAAAKKGRSRHARRQMSQIARLASISLAIIAPAAAASPMAMRYVPLDLVRCCGCRAPEEEKNWRGALRRPSALHVVTSFPWPMCGPAGCIFPP